MTEPSRCPVQHAAPADVPAAELPHDADRAAADTTDPHGRPLVRSHAEAVRVAQDAATFSNHVSRFLQVPNGLDGEEHREMRELLDPFFSTEAMVRLKPSLENVADSLVESLAPGAPIWSVREIGSVYAVRAQSTWLGWRSDVEDELIEWMDANHEATRSGELTRTREVAEWFDRIMRGLVAEHRESHGPEDVTHALTLVTKGDGAPLSEEELVSILRNWTGGDLGSLALCTGVLLHWLVEHPEHQAEWPVLSDSALDRAIDEVLRIDDPFTSNRRVTTCPVHVAGRDLEAGTQVVIDWTSANRDPEVFGDPDSYDPEGHAADNLVYGTGAHVCPGRPLATLELRVLVRALLAQFRVSRAEGEAARAQWPLGGWERLPVLLTEVDGGAE